MPIRSSKPGTTPEFVRHANIDDLKGRLLFEEVDEDSLRPLLEHSVICRLDADKELLPTRQEVDYLYIILSGYVAISLTSRLIHNGKNFLAWRGPEQIIGEMRSIGNEPAEAEITTCEPSEFIEIRSEALTRAADRTATIYRNIARLLMKKMYDERHRSEIIQMSPSERKVAQTLLHLAEERCGKDRFKQTNRMLIPGIIHQDEIGAYIGAERETTNRSLCQLKRKKIITYVKSRNGSPITILDRAKLEKKATQPGKQRAARSRTSSKK